MEVNHGVPRFETRPIAGLKGNIFICACSYNWLVLQEDDNCSLLNLVNGGKIYLPPIPDDVYIYACLLTSPPSQPDCHVLFFFPQCVWFCRVGDPEFTRQTINFYVSAATVFQGKIYGMKYGDELVIIEFDSVLRELHFTPLTMMELPYAYLLGMKSACHYFIELHGELLLVSKMYLGQTRGNEFCGFKVFRMDFKKREWVRVTTMGDKTIFLSSLHGLCCGASEAGVKSNCIYFLESQDICVYVFDLEDQSISTYLPCPIVDKTPYSSWVMIS